MNVYALYRRHFAGALERTFIEQPGRPDITYAEADWHSAQLAGALRKLGLQRGDRVAVRLPKSPQVLFLLFACLRAGLVFVPLNHRAPTADALRIVQDAEAALVVQDAAASEPLLLPTNVLTCCLGQEHAGSLGELARSCKWEVDDVEPEDLALIVYTSGTTGKPKGVTWSHCFMADNAMRQFGQWGFGPDDVFLHALPLFHSHGISVALNSVLLGASRMRFIERFDAEEAIAQLRTCTVFSGVPTMYIRMLESPRFTPESCGRLRLFLSSSAALPEAVCAGIERRVGHRILECYGMTETGTLTSNPLAGERRLGSVGRALPGVELRVVDAEGRPAQPGGIGELQARKTRAFSGYWRQPELSTQLFTDDGFFRTGDLASLDPDGYLRVVGRTKEVIISGGFNIYPGELEQTFGRLPGVRHCFALGVAHPSLGEAPVLLVVADAAAVDERELITQARRQLAPHKLPRRIFFVESIARTPTGKYDARLLRERYRNTFW